MSDLMIATDVASSAPAPGPLAGSDRWAQVMERAGWRCQCERRHPKHRAGRCANEHHGGCKLVAGPRDPGSDPARKVATTDPADLIAWCPPCWDLAVKAAQRIEKSAARALGDDSPTLF